MDRPVVDTEDRRSRENSVGITADKSEQGVRADRHPELARQPRSGLAPERKGDGGQRLPLAIGAPGAGLGDAGEPFGEDPPRAGGVLAKELPDLDAETHGEGRPGQVRERAHVVAVDPIRPPAAAGARGTSRRRGGQNRQPILLQEQRLDVQRAGNRQDGGNHRPPPPAQEAGRSIRSPTSARAASPQVRENLFALTSSCSCRRPCRALVAVGPFMPILSDCSLILRYLWAFISGFAVLPPTR